MIGLTLVDDALADIAWTAVDDVAWAAVVDVAWVAVAAVVRGPERH